MRAYATAGGLPVSSAGCSSVASASCAPGPTSQWLPAPPPSHPNKGAGKSTPLRGGAVHLRQCEPVRLEVDLVVCQQQRAVDVEEDEPAHAASIPLRSVATYVRRASAPCRATSTAREPTTTPSASSAAA